MCCSLLLRVCLPFSVHANRLIRCTDNGTSKAVENIVLVVGIVVTIGAYVWIQRQMKAATPKFIYERRKARQAKSQTPLHYISLPDV